MWRKIISDQKIYINKLNKNLVLKFETFIWSFVGEVNKWWYPVEDRENIAWVLTELSTKTEVSENVVDGSDEITNKTSWWSGVVVKVHECLLEISWEDVQYWVQYEGHNPEDNLNCIFDSFGVACHGTGKTRVWGCCLNTKLFVEGWHFY